MTRNTTRIPNETVPNLPPPPATPDEEIAALQAQLAQTRVILGNVSRVLARMAVELDGVSGR